MQSCAVPPSATFERRVVYNKGRTLLLLAPAGHRQSCRPRDPLLPGGEQGRGAPGHGTAVWQAAVLMHFLKYHGTRLARTRRQANLLHGHAEA